MFLISYNMSKTSMRSMSPSNDEIYQFLDKKFEELKLHLKSQFKNEIMDDRFFPVLVVVRILYLAPTFCVIAYEDLVVVSEYVVINIVIRCLGFSE